MKDNGIESIISADQVLFLSNLKSNFELDVVSVDNMSKSFHSEMQKGLSGQPSSLKMLPAYLTPSTGLEQGRFLAIDLGGTNLRVLLVSLDGQGNALVVAVKKVLLPENIMKGSATELFDFIASCVELFFEQNEIRRDVNHLLGFTFSFPVEQQAVDSGKLIQWTKGFSIKDGIGDDIAVLLKHSFKRSHLECIKITALVNDTVGTLMEKSYSNSTCDMGVILGTGTNGCYLERIEKIEKIEFYSSKQEMIVNIEWGNFNGYRGTSYDKALDRESINPGVQPFEKMIAGMYLGELSRLIICDMIDKELLFAGTPSDVFRNTGILRTKDMSLIANDKTAVLAETNTFLTKLGIGKSSLADRQILQNIFYTVSNRAARIAAAAIASVVQWMDPLLIKNHSIAIDGSVFEKYPLFKHYMNDLLIEYFKNKSSFIELIQAEDGSGKGAAVTASTLT